MNAFRRGFADSRDRPGIIGNHRGLTRAALDRVSTGRRQFSLLVAGPGFRTWVGYADGFTSLKERAGVNRLMCPFFGVSGPGLGMPGGGPGSRWSARLDERPGGRSFSRLTLDQGREQLSGMWVGGPQGQVVSVAGARLRSSLRECPRLVAAGAWGGSAC